MQSSIVVLVLTFTMLGILLGFAALVDFTGDRRLLPPNIEDRDPAIQQMLFEECIEEYRSDGELTQEEYDRCAYSIYD
jgi:hypothetical protein